MNFILFLKILAWIGAVYYSITMLIAMYLGITYPGSLDQKLDTLQGKSRSYPVGKRFFMAAICIAALIAMRK